MIHEWDIKNCLSQLYPPFALQVEFWLNFVWTKTDLRPHIFCGYRSFQYQSELYSIGRRGKENEKIVTKAKAGFSFHNYGLAIDIVNDKNLQMPGLQALWDDPVWYDKIYSYSTKSIEWAGNWKSFKEYCHFQNTFGLTLIRLQQIFNQVNRKIPSLEWGKGMEEFYEGLDEETALVRDR